MSNQLRKIARANRMRPHPRQAAPVTLTRAQVELCMPDLPPIEPDGLSVADPVIEETIYSSRNATRRRNIRSSMLALLALTLSMPDKP